MRLENNEIVKFFLEVCNEILYYEAQSVNFKPDLGHKIKLDFFLSGLQALTLEIIENKSAFFC